MSDDDKRIVKKEKKSKAFDRAAVKRICVTAMCIGLGALCKLFSLNIVIFGGSGMTIGLAGIFTTLPALFYGPIYGAAASASADIIGCIIAPTGPYNPLFTLTAFAGGFIKGLVWKLLCRIDRRKLRTVGVACFALFLVLGVLFYSFLSHDGINKSVIATADSVPEKGELKGLEVSSVSRLITDRVRTTDTFTVQSVPDGETVIIPSVTYLGEKVSVAVGKGALAGHGELLYVFVPDDVKSVAYDESLSGVTFCISEKAKAYAALKDAGAKIVTESDHAALALELNAKGVFSAGGYTFTTNDSYRTNLAMYVSFATFALTLVGVLGLLLVAAEFVFSRVRKGEPTHALRIFAAIFTCEMVVTTLNTVILKEMTFASSWGNYPFIVVWIPRAIEGVFICVIQAYLITALLKAAEKALGSDVDGAASRKV